MKTEINQYGNRTGICYIVEFPEDNNYNYIGKTLDPSRRYREHRTNVKIPKDLIEGYEKYGFRDPRILFEANFPNEEDTDKIIREMERYFIAHYNTYKGPGANGNTGGDTSVCNGKTKKILSEMFTGDNNPAVTPERLVKRKRILKLLDQGIRICDIVRQTGYTRAMVNHTKRRYWKKKK